MANDVQENGRYLAAARAHLRYILGGNPLGVNFVTGADETSPKQPHIVPLHQPVAQCPACLSAGRTKAFTISRQRRCLRANPRRNVISTPSKAIQQSETAIYWNSVLYVLARMNKLGA